jgi:hypothetical protein
MSKNFFDQFDAPVVPGSAPAGSSGNFFDQFDDGAAPKAERARGAVDVARDLGASLIEGAQGTGRMLGAAGDTLAANAPGVVQAAQAQRAAAADGPQAKRRLMDDIQARKTANPDGGWFSAIRDVGSAAARNPEGTAQFVVEQAPNTAVSLGAGYLGAKGGAALGAMTGPLAPVAVPVLGGLGFLGGMFLGTSGLEIGGKAIEKAGDGSFSETDRGEAIREGAIKGGVITAVDGATLGIGGKVAGAFNRAAIQAGARAEANVLANAGVNVGSRVAVERALVDPVLRETAKEAGQTAAKAASTMGSRAAAAGTLLTMETVGEGAGEYLGELAATGKADKYDAVLESLAGLSQSAPETAWNMRRAAGNNLNSRGIAQAGAALAPAAPAAGTATGGAPGQPPAGPAFGADEVLAFAQRRMSELQVAVDGTPDVTMPGPNGKPITVKGKAAQFVGPEALRELEFLRANNASPETLAAAYGLRLLKPGEAAPPPQASDRQPNAGPLVRLAELQATAQSRRLTPQELAEAQSLLAGLGKEDAPPAPAPAPTPSAPISPADAPAVPPAAFVVPGAFRYSVTQQPSYEGLPPLSMEDAEFEMEVLQTSAERGRLTPASFAQSQIGSRLDTGQITAINDGLRVDPVGTIQALRAALAPVPPAPPAASDTASDTEMQNRDRGRAASVAQMQSIAGRPDYLRLGPSRTPDSGAPMVFAAGDDTTGIPSAAFGREDVAVMSDGQRVPFRYAVVEAGQVQPSNFADGAPNPAFGQRTPGSLIALSNGRSAGLRAAWDRGTADTYKAELVADAANHGVDVAAVGMLRNPVLVRLYSEGSNAPNMAARSQGQGLGMSPAELARQDAPLIDASVLSVWQGGDVTSVANRDFARAFVGKLAGAGQDVSGLVTGTGELSQPGRRRIEAALMTAAYGDPDLVAELYDSTDTDIAAIGGALRQAAGQWAQLRDAARSGQVEPAFDVTANLMQAVDMVRRARRDRGSLLDMTRQTDIETGASPDELTVEALRVLYGGQNLTRPRGRERVATTLNRFVDAARSAGAGGGLFGDAPTPMQALRALTAEGETDVRSDDAPGEPAGPAPSTQPLQTAADGGERPGAGNVSRVAAGGDGQAGQRPGSGAQRAEPDAAGAGGAGQAPGSDTQGVAASRAIGPFGPVLSEYRGDAQGAIAALTSLQDGEAVAALSHPEVGDIDLVWGEAGTGKKDGFGLAKLVRYHPEVVADLQGFLNRLTKDPKRSGPNRIRLVDARGEAAVGLDWKADQKVWLLTAYEKGVSDGTTMNTAGKDAAGDTTRRSADANENVAPMPAPTAQTEPGLTWWDSLTPAGKRAAMEKVGAAKLPERVLWGYIPEPVREKLRALMGGAQDPAMVDQPAAASAADSQGFVPAPGGGIDFGEITAEMGRAMRRQPGRIRLQAGDDTFGLRHIEARHGDQIRADGFASVEAFVAEVARRIDQIWQPSASAQLVAVEQVGRDRVMFVRLQAAQDGDYYTVQTAFPARRGFVEKKGWKLLWEGAGEMAPTTSGQSTPFAEPPVDAGGAATNASGQSSSSMVAPKSGTPAADGPSGAPGDVLDDELRDALGKLGDVLGDVFGAKKNITGPQYGAADLLPALSKVVELLVRKGFRTFKASAGKTAEIMRGNAATAPFVDAISPRQWKAAYNAIAEGFDGTDSEEAVSAVSTDEVKSIVAPATAVASSQQNAAQEAAVNADPVPTQQLPAGDPAQDRLDAAAGGGDRQPLDAGLAQAGEGAAGGGGVSAGAQGAGGAGAQRPGQRDGAASGAPRDRAGVGPEPGAADGFDLDGQDIGSGGLTRKYRDNIAAIRIIKALEAEGRPSTAEERRALREAGLGEALDELLALADAKDGAAPDTSAANISQTGAPEGNETDVVFSRTMGAQSPALRALADTDDLFALPTPLGLTVEEIAAETGAGVTVRQVAAAPGAAQTWRLTLPDGGGVADISVRKANRFGPRVYSFSTNDNNEMVEPLLQRPGRGEEQVPQDIEEVILDASRVIEGGGGNLAYLIAGALAHNTGRMFIGDPAGLSDAALRRRSEQMLSLALKYGTTDFLAPHPDQVSGNRSLGVPPLDWVYGDDENNVEQLIAVNVAAMENALPNIAAVEFDVNTGEFRASDPGSPGALALVSGGEGGAALDLRASQLGRRAGEGDLRAARAGGRTLARAAVLRAVLREARSARAGGVGGRSAVLDGLAGARGRLPRNVFYSRSGVAGGGRSAPAPFERGIPGAMSTGAVQLVVDNIAARWAGAPRIVVVSSMQDQRVPEQARLADAAQRAGGATGAPRGFFLDGTVYLVANGLTGIDDVAETLAHEALGHFGLREVFGAALAGILDQIAMARPELMRDVAKKYGRVLTLADARARIVVQRMDAGQPALAGAALESAAQRLLTRHRREVAEEVLANMAQTQPTLGFVRRAVAAIRAWLRQNVPGLKAMRLTDAEIINAYILPARAFVERGAREQGVDGRQAIAFQRVWHGTPYRGIKRFDTELIGTGEGAQAYGWGLYFAGRKAVADYYRKKLAGDGSRTFTKDGKTIDTTADLMEAYYQPGRIVRGYSGADKVLEFKRTTDFGWTVKVVGVKPNGEPISSERPRWHATAPDAPTLKSVLEDDGWKASNPGQLYEVEIPGDEDMLLWDKPLHAQSPKIRALLRDIAEDLGDLPADYTVPALRKNKTGEDLYRAVAALGSDKFASQYLASWRIKGIKYLDGTSRAAGDGSYNYVIFDGADAEIVGTAFSRSATKSVAANIERGLQSLAEAVTGKTTVHRAMFRNGMGWVDFVWGDEGVVKPSGKTAGGRGLSHIVEARMRKDGLSEQQAIGVLNEMVRAIATGAETKRVESAGSVAVKVEHDGYRVALVKNPGTNAWVITAFEVGPDARPAGYATAAPTQTVASLSRDGLGAGPVASGADLPSLGGATRRDSTQRGSPAGAESPDSMSDRADGAMFSRNSIGPTPPPQPAPAQRNRWQALKQRVMNLTSPEALDKLIYELQDRFVDLKRIEAHIKALGGTVTDLNDAYLGEELFHKRLATRTERFLDDELRPLLAELKAGGSSMEEFEQFLHARHAAEANAAMAKRNPNLVEIDAMEQQAKAQVRDLELQLQRASQQGTATQAIERSLAQAREQLAEIGRIQPFPGTEAERLSLSGMSDADASAVLGGLSPQQRAVLDALAARVDAINAKTLDTLESYGLIDKGTLDAWRAAYRFYVPLHRDEAHPDSHSHPIGQGFNVRGAGVRQRVGSNQKVTNILGHIAMQREAALTRGEKNLVLQKLYVLVGQNPLRDFWRIDNPPTTKTVDPVTGTVRRQIDGTYRNLPNVVTLRIAGKDASILFEEGNPQALRLATAMKGADVGDLGFVTNMVSKYTRWFAAVNTQYNPIFGIVNMLRDVQGAALNLSTTPIAGKERQVLAGVLPALRAVWRKERGSRAANPGNAQWIALWEELELVGGATGFRDLYADINDRARQMQRELAALDRGPVARKFFWGGQLLSDFNEALENAVRVSAYKAALDAGMTKERAASLAKNLTVNFNRKGRAGRHIGAWYAFFNSAVQGTTRMVETLRGPKGRAIMAGGVALGVFNTLLGMAIMGGGGDDEEDNWDKIPEFVKERSIIIPLSSEDYISPPLPLGFHFLPNLGRLATEWALGGPGKTGGKQAVGVLQILLDAFNPLGGAQPIGQMVMPTVVDPFWALATNTDWNGRPIYREDRSPLDPQPGMARAKDTAPPWAKGIAQALNTISGGTKYQPGMWSPTPDQIDYIIGQLTGGVGREIGKLATMVAAPITGDELPLYKVPLVGRFAGSVRGTAGQSDKFYENVKAINQAENELRGRARNAEDVQAFRNEEPLAALAGAGDAYARRVSELRRMRREVAAAAQPGYREVMATLDEQIARTMTDLNRRVKEAQRTTVEP